MQLSTAFQVKFLFAGFLVLLWLLIALNLNRYYDQTRSANENRTRSLAYTLAEQAQASISAVDLMLLSLREFWQHDPGSFGAAVDRRQRELSNNLAFQVAIIDTQGKLVFSSVNSDAQSADLSDQEHLHVHGDGKLDVLFISKPVIRGTSERSSVQFTRAIRGQDGAFLGVIAISLSPEYFSRFYSGIGLEPGSSVTLVRTTGEILTRNPRVGTSAAQVLTHAPFMEPTAPASGFYQRVSLVDGIERIYGWQIVQGSNLVAVIGSPLDVVLASYRQQRFIHIVVGLAITFLIAMLWYFLLYNLRQRAATAASLVESEERWKLALESAGEGVWDWNVVTGELQLSRRWKQLLGHAEDEISDSLEEWKSRVHLDDLPETLRKLDEAMKCEGATYTAELRLRCKDGTWKWVLDRGMVVNRDGNGKPLRMIGTIFDISERKDAEESIWLAASVYQHTGEGMMVVDASGTIVNVNPAFSALTGFSRDETIGAHVARFSAGIRKQLSLSEMNHRFPGRQWKGETRTRRKDGKRLYLWITANAIVDDSGSINRWVVMFADITERKQSEELIWKQAYLDPLTGLANRRMFQQRMEFILDQAQRTGSSGALLYLDLDHFKEINDSLGHDVGDLLLKEAAKRLVDCIRRTDSVARLGGDEFILNITDVSNIAHVDAIAKKILQRITEPFNLGATTVHVSTSIGIALYPLNASDLTELVRNADQAMYNAKSRGRNCYSYFTPSMEQAAQTRMRIATDLRIALAQDQFQLAYQPIVDLRKGHVCKAEALLRWHHPTRGLISPAEFIAVAEDTGVIVEIGDWVFHEAAEQIARWRASGQATIQVSVNVSPAQFRDDRLCAEAWLQHLSRLGLQGSDIVIEITEGLLLDNHVNVAERLLGFDNAGIQIAVDDFGTGYSSLAYLKKIAVDYLKIDQAFVRNLHAGSSDMALCEAIVVMAHKLGLKVVAEGIETQEQCDILLGIGCDYGQGFLFSRPVSAKDLEALMQVPLMDQANA